MKNQDLQTESDSTLTLPDARIVRRYGGRHLIFRNRKAGWSLVPHPYLLISSFTGAVWVFYGVGQIWLTHRKLDKLDGWVVRSPRMRSKKLVELYRQLRSSLLEFTRFCNEKKIEGTLVLETRMIEFHWTFGPVKALEKLKQDHASELDVAFRKLVERFLEMSNRD